MDTEAVSILACNAGINEAKGGSVGVAVEIAGFTVARLCQCYMKYRGQPFAVWRQSSFRVAGFGKETVLEKYKTRRYQE
jgi:hypothetical protein